MKAVKKVTFWVLWWPVWLFQLGRSHASIISEYRRAWRIAEREAREASAEIDAAIATMDGAIHAAQVVFQQANERINQMDRIAR